MFTHFRTPNILVIFTVENKTQHLKVKEDGNEICNTKILRQNL